MSADSHGVCSQDSCRMPVDVSTAEQSLTTAQQAYVAVNNTPTADITESTRKAKCWVSETISFIVCPMQCTALDRI